jgi:hypothetical protein
LQSRSGQFFGVQHRCGSTPLPQTSSFMQSHVIVPAQLSEMVPHSPGSHVVFGTQASIPHFPWSQAPPSQSWQGVAKLSHL